MIVLEVCISSFTIYEHGDIYNLLSRCIAANKFNDFSILFSVINI